MRKKKKIGAQTRIANSAQMCKVHWTCQDESMESSGEEDLEAIIHGV